jgi:SlyX protein
LSWPPGLTAHTRANDGAYAGASIVRRQMEGIPQAHRLCQNADMTDTSRIEALEVRIAHHERMIDDLNQTITSQWKDIDRLKREVERLTDRVANAELAIGPDGADEPPPPHW